MVKNLITRNYVHNLLRIFQGIIQFLTGTIFATLLRIHPQVYDYNQSIFSSFSLCFQFQSNAHHIPLFHKMRVDNIMPLKESVEGRDSKLENSNDECISCKKRVIALIQRSWTTTSTVLTPIVAISVISVDCYQDKIEILLLRVLYKLHDAQRTRTLCLVHYPQQFCSFNNSAPILLNTSRSDN